LSKTGELDEAIMIAREAAAVYAQQGFLWAFLITIARLALKRGHPTEAASVFGCADAMSSWRDAEPPPATMREREDLLRQLQEIFAEADLTRLFAEGAALSDEEAARIGLAQ